MAQVIDVEIIANSLFKSLFKTICNNEQNIITNIINLNEKIKNNRNDIITNFDNKFDGWFENLTNGHQDLNEDIINLINNKFDILYSFINNSIKNEIIKIKEEFSSCFNFFKTEEKKEKIKSKNKSRTFNGEKTKVCGCSRSRNKGPCKKIISIDKNYCKYHENQKNDNINNIDEKQDEFYNDFVDLEINNNEEEYIYEDDILSDYELEHPCSQCMTNMITIEEIQYGYCKKCQEKMKEMENNYLEYSCKNECCCDYVYKPNTFCEDCIKEIKNCKKCNEQYWTDMDDVIYCNECN